jgi:hypothetical protein
MESRSFIRATVTLIEKIKFINIGLTSVEDERQKRSDIQKEINQMFGGLQNPTLPSAYNLRDAALQNGFMVDPKVQHRLAQFENLSA